MPKTKPHYLSRHPYLYLKHTKTKGRGVFATRAIKAGEVLEVTPTLILNERESKLVAKTVLRDYVFVVGAIPAPMKRKLGITKTDDASCVIMGAMTYCNHDEHPNAEIEWEVVEGTVYHMLKATRRIPRNTEICTSYGEGWFDTSRRNN